MFGGAVYNFTTIVFKGNLALASYSSAFVESAINDGLKYIHHEKEFTKENIEASILKVSAETVFNGSLYVAAGAIADISVPVNYKSWIKPTKFSSCLMGNYAKKVVAQTVIQGTSINAEKLLIRPYTNAFKMAGYL